MSQRLYDSTVSASHVRPGRSEAGGGHVSRRDAPERTGGAASTVLVVNDSADSLELMRLVLSGAGYGVLTAFDGREGFEVASRERPCLVVSDVSMPRADGIELCRLMRAHEELRDTPVLLVSAIRKDSESVVEGLKAGADDYLEAPYDPALLLAKVAQLVGRKQAEEQIRQLNETLEARVRERTGQLEAANKELEAFSYSVSHDLRAPLRHIDGFSRALLEDYEDKLDEAGKGYLREVRAASREMARLIDEVLQLARVSRGEISREVVSLSELARGVVAGLRKADAGRDVFVRIEEGLTVRGDRRLLQVVLVNLLGNAWKFTSKARRAEVVFGRVEGISGPVYFVRDNGAGFDMAYAHKLFIAFQRLHGLDEFEGTGVGLATVRRVVNRHGGRVWAEGAVGHGATFYFTIPECEGVRLEEQSDSAGGRQPEG